ncbi:MAG TPA: DUF1329 domain-containing protein [Caldimonas sp.]|nr:DUF1329 domain-containing protein [Caldimonas sp.]
MTHHKTARFAALLAAMSLAVPAVAAVSDEQAQKLKGDLTPFGSEKAGNAAGTIPPWTGGYTSPVPDLASGQRGDPFKDEKPLFTITAKNADQYAEKLTDGQKALLAKYPDTYNLQVYPTHRTAAAPQWFYENTFKNATRARLVGDSMAGGFAGVPFPIPTSGAEVIWNHITRWRGTTVHFRVGNWQLTTDGRPVLTSTVDAREQMPYFMPDRPEVLAKTNEYWMIRVDTTAPALRTGESIIGRFQLDPSKDQAWVNLTGQHRVRKLPTPCCDMPSPNSAGLLMFDEHDVFSGRLDRFDWKLLGKQEKFIPYNNNKIFTPAKDTDFLSAHHVNPDYLRWELHRVWVVEATLRAGARHVAPRSRYYCDEDTWICELGDRWDAKGQLWRTVWRTNYVDPDGPGTMPGPYGMNDLIAGVAFISEIYAWPNTVRLIKPVEDNYFTPDALAATTVR